ncbi:MAG TPA: hypothetical protein VNX22_06810 [Acidobacteriaceae bacterium]|nr:hypothetical protein [Acidobacteriaceae bacterium]
MTRTRSFFILFILLVCTLGGEAYAQDHRWSEQKANDWYKQQPWLVGANYIPKTAINQLEMWQADTFDPKEIDLELGWAEGIGMNTMRVFLHDLLWQQDQAGFEKRVDTFLTIAAKHHIKPLFVLFDSCWDPYPELGPQHPPIPGVHNSGWVQSPGANGLTDQSQYERLHAYTTGIVKAFANDERILGWDVWNEPNNTNVPAYSKQEPKNKVELVNALLPQVFAWAREAHPVQPLTSGVWDGDWSSLEKMSATGRIQIQESDVITFHNYGWPEDFEAHVKLLQQYHRPLICTEYMARGAGSTFDTVLPIAKKYNVAAINWGLVVGKTQTNMPWDSWVRPYTLEQPTVWFHEVFYGDGKPYREREVELIRELSGRGSK